MFHRNANHSININHLKEYPAIPFASTRLSSSQAGEKAATQLWPVLSCILYSHRFLKDFFNTLQQFPRAERLTHIR
jgi:hypothetical protein